MKEPWVEKLKSKSQKKKALALQYSENAKTSKKAWKKKKKNCRHQRSHWALKNGRPQEGSSLATKVNNTSAGSSLRKNQNRPAKQDLA